MPSARIVSDQRELTAKSQKRTAKGELPTANSKKVMRNFRQYDIWLQSVDFATEVYKLTEIFPNVEKYSLTDQIRRAVVSISSNVAEGCSRESEKEFFHYVQVALGSAFEVETQLRIALSVKYITQEQYDAIILPLEKLERQLNKLHSVLKSSIYNK